MPAVVVLTPTRAGRRSRRGTAAGAVRPGRGGLGLRPVGHRTLQGRVAGRRRRRWGHRVSGHGPTAPRVRCRFVLEMVKEGSRWPTRVDRPGGGSRRRPWCPRLGGATALAALLAATFALATPSGAAQPDPVLPPPSADVFVTTTNAMMRPGDVPASLLPQGAWSVGYQSPPGGQDPFPACVYGRNAAVTLPLANAIAYQSGADRLSQVVYDYSSTAKAQAAWARINRQVPAKRAAPTPSTDRRRRLRLAGSPPPLVAPRAGGPLNVSGSSGHWHLPDRPPRGRRHPDGVPLRQRGQRDQGAGAGIDA